MNARSLLVRGGAVSACALGALLVLRLAVAARVPGGLAPLLVTLAMIAPVLALSCTDPRELARRTWWTDHPATALTVLAFLIGLPLLGSYSLVDPWETHYAEVAREMLERHDLLSPWWAHDGWFRSKPVLLFWLEAPAMKLLGVGTGPDQVLAGALGAAHPEYAVRLPGFLLLGALLLQRGLATLGTRVAALVALVFLTMAGTVMLAHQAITDTPLLGATAAALGLLAAAELVGPGAEVRSFTIRIGARALTLHAGHLVAAVLLVTVAPQLVLIATAGPIHAGSPHACTLPGQPACAAVKMAHPALAAWRQLLVWIPLLVTLAASFTGETRLDRLLAAGAWIAAAVGTMAKGPVGLVVPAAGALVALASGRSWRLLLRLEIVRGLLTVVLLVAPWYVAMYARHGKPFWDELVLRNMLGRTLDHLHDTNSSEDTGVTYFVKQLGYGTFPWSGLALVAMLSAARRGDRRGGSPRDRVRALFFGSALATFVLVSTMGTKFHHYVLVSLPGVAAVTGMFLGERIAARSSRESGGAARFTWGVLVVVATVVTWLVARDFTVPVTDDAAGPSGAARFFHLLTYRYDRHWVSSARFVPFLAVAGVIVAVVVGFLGVRPRRLRARVIGVFLGGAVLFAVWLGNVYPAVAAHDGGQRELLARYESERARRQDSGPLVAYELNWKGENFYTGNDVAIFMNGGTGFHEYVQSERERGRALYIVTERPRLGSLRAELGAGASVEELGSAAECEEFVLVRVGR